MPLTKVRIAMAALVAAAGAIALLLLLSAPAHAQVADDDRAFVDASAGDGGSARGGDGGRGGDGILPVCSSNSNDAEPGDLDYGVHCGAGGVGGDGGDAGISEGGDGGIAFAIGPPPQPKGPAPATPLADLALTTTATGGTCVITTQTNCQLQFVITVTNIGGATASSVGLTNTATIAPLGPLFTAQAAVPSQGTCTVPPAVGNTASFTCSLGGLAPGQSTQITATYLTVALNGFVYAVGVTATGSTTTPEPTITNNTGADTASIDAGGGVTS